MSMVHGTPVVDSENGHDEREPDLQSQSGRPGSLPTPLSRREQRFAKAGKQVSYEPVQPSAEDWENQDPEIIKQNYAQIDKDFFSFSKSTRIRRTRPVAVICRFYRAIHAGVS
jgi:hypothetical protein